VIAIVPYDSNWPVAFAAERDRILAALGSLARRIDHHGSTAVPGLAAKPIIDIQVSVVSLQPLTPLVSALAALGYVHVPHADDEICPFLHRPAQWPHTHHVHLIQAGGAGERRTVAFRDYLRDHLETAREYAALKRQLASAHGVSTFMAREAYAAAKTPFVTRVTDAALAAGYPFPGLDLPLRTARLLLRDFAADDFTAVHDYASDPDVTRFMFYGPRTPDETRAYLERMLASQRERPRRVWELAVVRAADRRLIGACDLTLDVPGEGDLGFILARDAWGQGYASEAARTLVCEGFQRLGVSRIVATCDVANHASAGVLEKAGLRRERTLEQHRYSKGRWWTSYLYSLERHAWLAEAASLREP
jgi:RimJ/RimL family protein N-acetyltransferase